MSGKNMLLGGMMMLTGITGSAYVINNQRLKTDIYKDESAVRSIVTNQQFNEIKELCDKPFSVSKRAINWAEAVKVKGKSERAIREALNNIKNVSKSIK